MIITYIHTLVKALLFILVRMHIYYYVATIELIPMIIHQSFIKHEKRMCLIFVVYVGMHVRMACVAP